MSAVCVVIYGASLILAAIEARISDWPGFTVVHVDPRLPLALERIHSLHPQIVIVDGSDDYTGICPSTILCVDPDANNQAAIFNNQRHPIDHAGALVDLILAVVIQ